MRVLIWFFAITFNLTMVAHAETFRDWQVVEKYNEVTQKIEAYAFTYAKKGKTKFGERPYMGINCKSVYFGNLAVIDEGDVNWRFNNQNKSELISGDEWQGNNGTTIKFRWAINQSNSAKAFRYYKTYFKDFISAKALYVNFDMYSAPELTATFSMMGVTAAIDRLQNNCWVDRSGYPMSINFAKKQIVAIEKLQQSGKKITESAVSKILKQYEFDSLN